MKIDGIEILCDADIRRALVLKFYKFADQFNYSDRIIELFEATLQDDAELIKRGHGSTVVVAARIYTTGLSSGERISQKRTSIAMNCSIGALSKLYRFKRKKNRRD